MDYTIRIDNDPCTLVIAFSSLKSCQLTVQVWDDNQANTFLADRTCVTRPGQADFCCIPMPLAPGIAHISINDTSGGADSASYTVLSIQKMKLKRYEDAIDWLKPELLQAINLGSHFCYNAGWLATNDEDQAYCSIDRSLKMQYLPTLEDPETGKESVTPMRIGDSTGIMQASQKLVVPFTVPGRLVMFYHEFSHKFENKDISWELEADLNGLTIYLGLGFSPYEAKQIYRTIFKKVDSPENQERLVHIEAFIDNFSTYIKH